MAVLNHPHTYERSLENNEIYRCVHPQCSHFTRRSLIVGKEIDCFVCHDKTIARNEQLHAGQDKIGVKRLTCLICSKTKNKVNLVAASSALDELLKGI